MNEIGKKIWYYDADFLTKAAEAAMQHIKRYMNKKLIFPAVIAVLGITGWLVFRGGAEQAGSPKIAVEAVRVERKNVHDNIEALGTAYANESIRVTATASEIISEINFTDGQTAKQGDIIARLEQREEQAQLAAVKAQIEEHQRELARISNLLEKKAAAKRDYDERNTQLKIAQQEAEAIEARIEERTLRAPFDGVLGIRRLSVGALVQPGDIITTLDDLTPIKLDFTVPAVFLASLKPGVAIQARTEAMTSTIFKGKVESVDTRIDPVTRSVLVRALLPNGDGKIRPGLLMQVTVLSDPREALVVPEESIMQRQDKHYVMVVAPDTKTVEERTVEVGTRQPGFAEIKKGLEEGEMVITRGNIRVRKGQEVTIKSQPVTQ